MLSEVLSVNISNFRKGCKLCINYKTVNEFQYKCSKITL